MTAQRILRLATVWLGGCAGCHMSLLDLDEHLLELYAAADVMLYPTLTESFGQPLLEALALGLPVIASDIPINRELAQEAVLYFDPLDPAALAGRVEELIGDASLQAALRERARSLTENFSWAGHTDEILRRLEDLLRQRNSAQRIHG